MIDITKMTDDQIEDITLMSNESVTAILQHIKNMGIDLDTVFVHDDEFRGDLVSLVFEEIAKVVVK